ncbi:hypothetical protein GDO81_016431 [Engystomops pustulosus]|uniref:Uncharacterized protein n=1 Tax=Engystomops pustulosus TaxID=76066 RepID=A0AAV7AXZ4_ENGPU|nr:hypothetical protein GDO81_016431 [Engystomops pustulosus]
MDSGGANLLLYTSPSSAHPGYANPPRNAPSTVVTIREDDNPIRDNLIWSFFNTIYCNLCCLGLVALSYSVKSRDRKLFKDFAGARRYGATARKFNIAVTTLLLVVVIIVVAIVCATIKRASPKGSSYSRNRY